jgi:hypothetical protein
MIGPDDGEGEVAHRLLKSRAQWLFLDNRIATILRRDDFISAPSLVRRHYQDMTIRADAGDNRTLPARQLQLGR